LNTCINKRFSGKKAHITAVMVGLLTAVGLIVLTTSRSEHKNNDVPTIGVRAADFAAPDLFGNAVSLSDYRGKVVLLDFWATWCGPCVSELPNVKYIYEKYKDAGLAVIGISLDANRNDLEYFVRIADIEWPQIFDGKGWENDLSRLYNIYSIPTTILLDRNGVIRYMNLRGHDELEHAVRDLLAPAADSPAAQE
jgi:thiol-disulfide isomerase/thioredoxin